MASTVATILEKKTIGTVVCYSFNTVNDKYCCNLVFYL